MSWPQTDVDSVARMRAMAAGTRGAVLLETVFDAPLDAVWGIAGDLENGTPQMEAGIERVEIVERQGDRLEVVTHGRFGFSVRLDAVLRPGWCVMNSTWGSIGMAATAVDETHTRFAHYEAVPWLGPLAPFVLRPKIRGDFKRLHALLG
jgi:hypothetical protein